MWIKYNIRQNKTKQKKKKHIKLITKRLLLCYENVHYVL